MSQPLSFDAEPIKDLDAIYEDLKEIVDEREFLQRVERNFGNYSKEDVFVQTSEFNVFLYLDGGTFNGARTDELENEVLDYIEETYDIETETLQI